MIILILFIALSRVAVPPTFVPAPVTKRPYSIAGLPGNFNAMQQEESSASPTVAPPILPRPVSTLSRGEYVDDEISATGYHSDCSSGESTAIPAKVLCNITWYSTELFNLFSE